MPTCPSCPPTHHTHPPIMPTSTQPSCPTLLGGMGAYTRPPMNSPTTHPMNPPTTPPPSTTHPMNHPKYMYSDRVTLWICLMGGWVCVHKIKYFNIVTLWVSEYMHPPHEASNHPPHHHTPTQPMNSPTTHPTTHSPTHEPSNHHITTHPMSHPKYMYSDRVTLWICLMGGWVFIK